MLRILACTLLVSLLACDSDKSAKKGAASVAELQSGASGDLACGATSECSDWPLYDGCTRSCDEAIPVTKARERELAQAVIQDCGTLEKNCKDDYRGYCKAGRCAVAKVIDMKKLDAWSAERETWKAEGGAKFKAGARFFTWDFKDLDAAPLKTCVVKDPVVAGAGRSGDLPYLVTFADEGCDVTRGFVKNEDYVRSPGLTIVKGATVYAQAIKDDAVPTCTLTVALVDKKANRNGELIEVTLPEGAAAAGCDALTKEQRSGFIPAGDLL